MLPLLEVMRRAETYLKERSVPSPRLSAESLLASVLGTGRLELYLDFARPLEELELAAYRKLVRRRGVHEPLQYILGGTSFRTLEVAVGPGVLVPRPETEQLVELVLGLVEQVAKNVQGSAGFPHADEKNAQGLLRVLDLCTGSGVVGLSLAAELPIGLWCLLADISPEALAWAVRNYRNSIGKISGPVSFCLGDLCEPLASKEYFHIIVSNPPYVAREEIPSLPEEVRRYEPVNSLEAGPPGGTGMIAGIVERAYQFMAPGALLAFEMGETQRPLVEEMFSRYRQFYHEPVFHRDLAGKERFATAFRN